MKRESPPTPPQDEAVALMQAKRQKTSETTKKATCLSDQISNSLLTQVRPPHKNPPSESSSAKPEKKIPYQDVLKSKNRHRLPDKIMRCLCDGVEPDVLWWSPHENGFTMDGDTVQKKLLDVHFRGTKLSSLVRSLNRWGFRRDFYRTLPKKALAFLHPQFQKGKPHLLREMKICSPTTQVVDSSDEDEAEIKKKKKGGQQQSNGNSGSSNNNNNGKNRSLAAGLPQAGLLGGGSSHAASQRLTQQKHQVSAAAAAAATSASFPGGAGGLFNTFGGQSSNATAGLLAGIPASLLQQQSHQAQPQSQSVQQAHNLLNPRLVINSGLMQSNPARPAAAATNPLLQGNAFRDATFLQVRSEKPVQERRDMTNLLLSNALGRTGLKSGIPSISITNQFMQQQQQQQQQQHQQQDQMSALLQLQALRGTTSADTPREAPLLSQNQQLQELMLARQREQNLTLRMLQLNQLQQQRNPDQGNLGVAGSLTQPQLQQQQLQPQEQQPQEQQQPATQLPLQSSAAAQLALAQCQGGGLLNDQELLMVMGREREQQRSAQLMELMRQIEGGRAAAGDGDNRLSRVDP